MHCLYSFLCNHIDWKLNRLRDESAEVCLIIPVSVYCMFLWFASGRTKTDYIHGQSWLPYDSAACIYPSDFLHDSQTLNAVVLVVGVRKGARWGCPIYILPGLGSFTCSRIAIDRALWRSPPHMLQVALEQTRVNWTLREVENGKKGRSTYWKGRLRWKRRSWTRSQTRASHVRRAGRCTEWRVWTQEKTMREHTAGAELPAWRPYPLPLPANEGS